MNRDSPEPYTAGASWTGAVPLRPLFHSHLGLLYLFKPKTNHQSHRGNAPIPQNPSGAIFQNFHLVAALMLQRFTCELP